MAPQPARCLAALLLLGLSGCMGPWDAAWNKADTAVSSDGTDGTQDSDSGGGTSEVVVTESIINDTTWTSDTVWVLDGPIFVESTATLTIEAGTTVKGRNGSALVVTRDASLYARGEADAPIVFTSAEPVGSRSRGDWGGLVMLGNAPVNVADAVIEGIPDDPRGAYGGSDPSESCGTLQYARIEFAGFEAFEGNELNGLSMGGCGAGTIVRYVQVHMTLDDGIEMFGGTANLRHIVLTRVYDDSLDWDRGWQGNAQFVVIQTDPSADESGVGDNAFECDNDEDDHFGTPLSAPTLYNLTVVGAADSTAAAQRGATVRHGTAGIFRNLLLTNLSKEIVDVRDESTVANIDQDPGEGNLGALSIDHSLFFNIGPDGDNWADDETSDDDDGGFDELAWLQQAEMANRFGIDPLLPEAATNPTAPEFVPAAESPAGSGGAPPPEGEFWDETATYIGAFRPGDSNPWTNGWTAFPDS